MFQELFYNPARNTGWFIPVIKARRKNDPNKNINDNEPHDNENDECVEYTEKDAIADVEKMRTGLVNKFTMETYEKRLKATIDYRNKICDDQNINLLERFPYFFTHSELV